MLVLSCIVSAAARAGAPATSFDVTNNGMASLSINGAANPTLTLTRGQTYVFNVTAIGHPFWITTARGAGDTESNAFSDGVTGNGASPGTLTFVVPATAPATLFYQCAFHDPMGGTLLIISPPPPPPVPAVSTGLMVALGALLVVSAVTALRRRAR